MADEARLMEHVKIAARVARVALFFRQRIEIMVWIDVLIQTQLFADVSCEFQGAAAS